MEEEAVDYSEKRNCWHITYCSLKRSVMKRRCSKCLTEHSILIKHNNVGCSSKSCRVLQPPQTIGTFENPYYRYCVNCFEECYDTGLSDSIADEVKKKKGYIRYNKTKNQMRDWGKYHGYVPDIILPVKVTRKLPTWRNSKRARE